MTDEPIRTEFAILAGSPLNKFGTVLLYRDRISHVTSARSFIGMLRGPIPWLVRRKVGEKAAGKEAEGERGVATIRLADVAEVRRVTHGPNPNLLEVVGTDGGAMLICVKFDQWKADLVAALQGAGRTVTDRGDVVSVTESGDR